VDSKIYLVINGDNTSEGLSQNIVNDDVQGLADNTGKIDSTRKVIDGIVQEAGGKVIISASDEAVYELPSSDYSELAQKIMQTYKESLGNSVTVGMGSTLSQAYEALINGKNTGKDKYVSYDSMEEKSPEDMDEQSEEMEVPEINEGNSQEMEDQPSFHEDEDDMPEQDEDDMDFDDSFVPEDMEEQSDEMESPENMEEQSDNDEFVEDEDEMDHKDIHSLLSHHLGLQDEENEDEEQDMEDIPYLQPHEHEQEQGESSEFENEGEVNEGDLQGQVSDESEGEEQSNEEETSKEELKQKIAESLRQFKENKGAIEEARLNDPEAYKSMINMLRAMIEMAKQLNIDVSEQESEMPTDSMEQSDESPEMMDNQVPNAPSIQVPKM
jgi:hypothetical protein